mmetsp:Transcript_18462/g.28480  ORF Transcript_18462/g.28480 Transcript_18462/m.28480 type:complete len:86 (+) Transcript_18462:1253-1510(+)
MFISLNQINDGWTKHRIEGRYFSDGRFKKFGSGIACSDQLPSNDVSSSRLFSTFSTSANDFGTSRAKSDYHDNHDNYFRRRRLPV